MGAPATHGEAPVIRPSSNCRGLSHLRSASHISPSAAKLWACCGTSQPRRLARPQKPQRKPENRARPRIAATGASAKMSAEIGAISKCGRGRPRPHAASPATRASVKCTSAEAHFLPRVGVRQCDYDHRIAGFSQRKRPRAEMRGSVGGRTRSVQ
jgi:hypothetical protein